MNRFPLNAFLQWSDNPGAVPKKKNAESLERRSQKMKRFRDWNEIVSGSGSSIDKADKLKQV
jgi:hypothetical protein